MTQPLYDTIPKAAQETYEPHKYVTFAGFEWSIDSLGHIVIINNPDITYDQDFYIDKRKPSLNTTYDWLRGRQSVAFFNHPGAMAKWHPKLGPKEFAHFSRYSKIPDNIVGMELFNKDDAFREYYYNDGFQGPNPNYDRKGYYDEALLNGWHIGAAGSDDAHNADWGTMNDYRLAVLAKELTREAIFDALMERRFYSTLDRNLSLSFTVGGHEMGSVIKPGSHPMIIRANDGDDEIFIKAELIKNGNVQETWRMKEKSLHIQQQIEAQTGDYFYTKVTQKDGDEAISSPIFIE